ncbi:MAG TPA: DUF6600 domain-containing protein [Verrucomicrobiae bacterium]
MKTNYSVGKIGLVTLVLSALTGCTTYVVQQPEPQTAYTPPPPPEPVVVQQEAPPPAAPAVVVIQNENDFYQPLSPYGQWVTVDGYGQCWRPSQVDASWRPYANGHWELTEAGWYWESDEPWAWATYHYGRWELAGGYGWIWVPQTQWAPAWVSWRSGGGYVGWAPLPPEHRGGVGVNVTIAPAAFCFVEERRMHDPVRPTTVIVNNTTIINKTVNITKTKVVNKVVINDGPRADEVERVSGRKFQAVSTAELRHKEEQPVAERQRNVRAVDNRVQQPNPRQDNRPQDVRNPAPHPVPVTQPEPRVVQPLPALRNPPPRGTQPAGDLNNRERPVREQNPAPAPAPREVRPVEGRLTRRRPRKTHGNISRADRSRRFSRRRNRKTDAR